MQSMRHVLFPLVFMLLSTIGLAQEFQGKATYFSKTSMDLDLDGRQISEAQKQRIRERMKSVSERTYELTFDKTSSLYEEEEKLETPSNGQGGGRGGLRVFASISGADGKFYKNVQDQRYLNQTEMFGKQFLIQDSLNQWHWELGSETKKIGNYTCYKATTVIQPDSTSFERFRRMARRTRDSSGQGRSGNEKSVQKDSVSSTTDNTSNNSLLSRIEPPQERTITAWYTPEIPISQGPGPYWGLPGLILEVNDGRTAILCNKIVLNTEDKEEIKAPSKGKKVSQAEYNEIMTEKMEQMSERFRAGDRRGNSSIRVIRSN